MTPQELSEELKKVLITLINENKLNLEEKDIPERVQVERPKNRDHGDWATNIAMQLAKRAGTNPRALAELIKAKMEKQDGIDSLKIAGPGFINIRLSAGSAGQLAATILEQGANYGKNNLYQGLKINLEFVSANPTGPLHIGGTRWAAMGDSLARVLENAGAIVTREYYFNDHGSQIDHFVDSLIARAHNQDPPENGYGGEYITDIANRVIAHAKEKGDFQPLELPEEECREYFRTVGVGMMFDEIKQDLENFGVHFDVYFHEDELHKSGAVEEAVQKLRNRDMTIIHDGAEWLLTTKFGDDKDRVLFKSDGEAAYFVGDLAYYLNKRERGADDCIYILGADHHGYVARMMAMCAAYGDQPGKNMEILIGQLVNLLRGGEPVRMSKRAGTVVTMQDLVDAVGVDAARYALVRSSIDSQVDIDLDLLASKTNENPVYYVQYAHARTHSVARKAANFGVTLKGNFDPSQLIHEADSNLLGVLAEFPYICQQAAKGREPYRIAHYLETLASAYHTWYGQCRVAPASGETPNAKNFARCYLNAATAQVLRNGLHLIGVSAPEKM